jgi:hypothetical protein
MLDETFATICAHVHVSAAMECAKQLVLLDEVRQLIEQGSQRNTVGQPASNFEASRLARLLQGLEDAMVTVAEATDVLLLENLELRRELCREE